LDTARTRLQTLKGGFRTRPKCVKRGRVKRGGRKVFIPDGPGRGMGDGKARRAQIVGRRAKLGESGQRMGTGIRVQGIFLQC